MCLRTATQPQAPIINNHFFISSLVFSTPEVKHLVVPSSALGNFLLFMSLVFERPEVITFIRSRTAFGADDGFVDASNKHFGVEISGVSDFRLNRTRHNGKVAKLHTFNIENSPLVPMLRKFPSLRLDAFSLIKRRPQIVPSQISHSTDFFPPPNQ